MLLASDTVGGGKVLEVIGNDKQDVFSGMDTDLMRSFAAIGGVKIVIAILIVLIMLMLLLRMLRIKSVFRGRGIKNELEYMKKVRKHEARILMANRALKQITIFIESTPLCLNKAVTEYWQYNLTRAGIRVPGKTRIIKAEEFNALIQVVTIMLCFVGIVASIFSNLGLGILTICMTIFISSTIPMRFLRTMVGTKDTEIRENFADYYLMIHYVLLEHSGTPLSSIMRQYAKTTESPEMQRLVDTCVHYMDTYGEYEGTRYIASEYRELNEIGKLMRLIRQCNDGGDVEAELFNFRQEVLADKKYALTRRKEKIVAKAKASFYVLGPILVQAVLSAMGIYLADMNVGGFLGM